LGYRINTPWFAGHYGLIGGSVEEKKSGTEALMREIQEETGITVNSKDVEFAHVIDFLGVDDAPCVAFFYFVKTWQGDVNNSEKNKHDHLKWFPIDKLPENMIPRHKKAIELNAKRIFYSEDNWQNRP